MSIMLGYCYVPTEVVRQVSIIVIAYSPDILLPCAHRRTEN